MEQSLLGNYLQIILSFVIIGPLLVFVSWLIKRKNQKIAKIVAGIGIIVTAIGIYAGYRFVQGQKEVSDFKKESQTKE